MAGYDGFSMSNNAVAAYDNGLLPASKIKGVPARLVKEFCRYAEWHHSSSHFNRIEFYNPVKVKVIFGLIPNTHSDADPEWETNPDAIAALAAWKVEAKAGGQVFENCEVEWIEWSGSLKHPKATERKASGCRVTVKRQTATIELPSGEKFAKRLTTNGFNFTTS